MNPEKCQSIKGYINKLRIFFRILSGDLPQWENIFYC